MILEKYSHILSSLYELFNLNYIKKDGKNYARISVGKSREQFIEINPNFKVILLFDKDEVLKIMQPTASRFEKMEINFSNLLKENDIIDAKTMEKNINEITSIKLENPLNYDLNNLIINLDLEEIQSMFFYCKNNEKNAKEYIYKKLIPALPQDIMGCLIFDGFYDQDCNDKDDIMTEYNNCDKYCNINSYIKVCKSKFSIIYTFSNLSEFFNEDDSIKIKMESEIKCEDDLEILLNDFYKDTELKILALKIQESSANDIIYLKAFINEYENSFKRRADYNDECENKKFIFYISCTKKILYK